MKTDHRSEYHPAVRPALATALLLMIPLVAMQVTNEVNWSLSDFAIMGALLFGTGLLYELAARRAGNTAYRAAVGIALAAAFLLVWINLAVGIIGSEDNPVNVMYFGVLAIAFLGAILARLRPHGMARAMFATALALALIGVTALIAGLGSTAFELLRIVGVSGIFVTLFLGSALLFRSAAARAHERSAL